MRARRSPVRPINKLLYPLQRPLTDGIVTETLNEEELLWERNLKELDELPTGSEKRRMIAELERDIERDIYPCTDRIQNIHGQLSSYGFRRGRFNNDEDTAESFTKTIDEKEREISKEKTSKRVLFGGILGTAGLASLTVPVLIGVFVPPAWPVLAVAGMIALTLVAVDVIISYFTFKALVQIDKASDHVVTDLRQDQSHLRQAKEACTLSKRTELEKSKAMYQKIIFNQTKKLEELKRIKNPAPVVSSVQASTSGVALRVESPPRVSESKNALFSSGATSSSTATLLSQEEERPTYGS